MPPFVALARSVRLRNHRQLSSQLETRIPRRAFAGATLEVLYAGDGLDRLDETTRSQAIAFAEDFLDCGCGGAPHCGHPERAFLRDVLERRAGGSSPEDIIHEIEAAYGLTAYPGDVLTFLDEAVRQLDAIEALAGVDGARTIAEDAAQRRRSLEGS